MDFYIGTCARCDSRAVHVEKWSGCCLKCLKRTEKVFDVGTLTKKERETLQQVRDGSGGSLRHFDLIRLRDLGMINGHDFRPVITEKGTNALEEPL